MKKAAEERAFAKDSQSKYDKRTAGTYDKDGKFKEDESVLFPHTSYYKKNNPSEGKYFRFKNWLVFRKDQQLFHLWGRGDIKKGDNKNKDERDIDDDGNLVALEEGTRDAMDMFP